MRIQFLQMVLILGLLLSTNEVSAQAEQEQASKIAEIIENFKKLVEMLTGAESDELMAQLEAFESQSGYSWWMTRFATETSSFAKINNSEDSIHLARVRRMPAYATVEATVHETEDGFEVSFESKTNGGKLSNSKLNKMVEAAAAQFLSDPPKTSRSLGLALTDLEIEVLRAMTVELGYNPDPQPDTIYVDWQVDSLFVNNEAAIAGASTEKEGPVGSVPGFGSVIVIDLVGNRWEVDNEGKVRRLGEGDGVDKVESDSETSGLVYEYIVSDDDAWQRLKETPYTAITPTTEKPKIPQGTQATVLGIVKDGKDKDVAMMQIKGQADTTYTTMSNLSKVEKLSKELKYKMKKDFEAVKLPYGSDKADKTYKKDASFTAYKKCGDYVRVKGEGENEIEGHWISKDVAIATEPEFPITTDQLEEIFPNNQDTVRIKEVVDALNKLSNEFGLTTKDRMAHFLAQIGTETGGLKDLDESSYYSPRRVVEKFGLSKYADLFQSYNSDPKQCVDVTYEADGGTLGYGKPGPVSPVFPYSTKLAIYQAYGHPTDSITSANFTQRVTDKNYNSGTLKVKTKHYGSDAKLFDVVYSCRMGNAGPSSGHGSTYKGKGFIHLTGRWSYKEVSKAWNKKYSGDKKYFHKKKEEGGHIEELTSNVQVAIKASLIFWELNNMNEKADKGISAVKIVSIAINGNNPNALDKRKEYTNKAYENLGD